MDICGTQSGEQTTPATKKSTDSNTAYPPEHPRNLIPELCRQMYKLGYEPFIQFWISITVDRRVMVLNQLGWVTGTGGGISIKLG